MSNEDEKTSMYDMANQFIKLANEIAKKDPSGTVGTAIRYAAARYNIFEASLHNDDLATKKETIIKEFTEDYRKMLDINIDEHIEQSSE